MSMNVYGISGLKSHGKDTLAKLIQRERDGFGTSQPFHIVHFATELKRLCKVIFGLTDEQMHNQELKEAPLPAPIEMDKYLRLMGEHTGLHIRHARKFANSPREVMQFFGTEYVRKSDDAYWVNCVLRTIEEQKDFVLVPDTRYPNEADALRSIGGSVIKVKRLDLPEGTDGHSSETEMAKIDPDLYLGTLTDNFGLQLRVAKLLAKSDFDYAMKYDYRKVEQALAVYKAGGTVSEFSETLGLPFDEAEFVLDYYRLIR